MTKTLFLDRDGTLIVEKDYLSDPDQVELIPGACEALAELAKRGWQFVVVTNQSGIGRGKYTVEAMEAVNHRVQEILATQGVSVSKWLFCPDQPNQATWLRKPSVGMGILANSDLSSAVMVGDKDSDIEFAKRLGIPSILVKTGYGKEQSSVTPDITLESLAELADGILDSMIPAGIASRTQKHFAESRSVMESFYQSAGPNIHAASAMIASAFADGKKVLLCGNGGSAADAQHVAAELVCRLSSDRERKALPALALSTDTSIITAYSNDYDFDGVFSRQVEALGQAGDVLVAISTSGNSKNVVKAVETAKAKGMQIVGFTGNPGAVGEASDVCISIPGVPTMRVQECHLLAYHILCDLIEVILFDNLEN